MKEDHGNVLERYIQVLDKRCIKGVAECLSESLEPQTKEEYFQLHELPKFPGTKEGT